MLKIGPLVLLDYWDDLILKRINPKKAPEIIIIPSAFKCS